MAIPEPVDPSTIATLSGVFAPVNDERDAADLTVHGDLPDDLPSRVPAGLHGNWFSQ